jgi:hypothetical protein
MMNRTQLLTYIRELEWHMATHPSDRWAAKLEAAKYVLTTGPGEAPAPVKGAAEGSRDIIPMLSRQEDASSLVSSPAHRERITIDEGRAEHFPKISSKNPNEPSPARPLALSGGEP